MRSLAGLGAFPADAVSAMNDERFFRSNGQLNGHVAVGRAEDLMILIRYSLGTPSIDPDS